MTKAQRRLLLFLQKCKLRDFPSYAEMADSLGLKSKGTIAKTIYELEEMGFVEREYRKQRSIKVIRKI